MGDRAGPRLGVRIMRRRPVAGPPIAQLADQVARLSRQFQYPDELGAGAAPLVLGGGGAPSVVVAASNSTDLSKLKADLICPGVNDEETIQAAVDLIPSGGRLLLTEGTFNVAINDVITLPDFTTLQGLGMWLTIINTTDVTGTVVTVGASCLIADLAITQSGGGGG